MNEVEVTLVGNLADDPELRFTPSGVAVCKFRMAQTPRVKSGDEWKDGEPIWLPVTAWREFAENVAATLTRGMRVIVKGRMSSRTYETREGDKRTVFEVEADAIGPDLRYAQAKIRKTERRDGGGDGGQRTTGDDGWSDAKPANADQQRQAQPQTAPAAASPADDW